MSHAPHPVFREPTNADIPVWRYMDFAKFVALLDARALFFSRADLLGDPFEGSLSGPSIHARLRFFEEVIAPQGKVSQDVLLKQLEQLSSTVEAMRRWTYISCWHMNEHQSAAMWNLYGRAGAGIAVQSTFAKLRSCLPNDILVGEVSYIDYERDLIPLNNLFWPFVVKRKSFEHERELRAVRSSPPVDGERLDLARQNATTGVLIPVDLNSLIMGVYVAPGCADWMRDVVNSTIKRFEFTWSAEKSSMDATPLY